MRTIAGYEVAQTLIALNRLDTQPRVRFMAVRGTAGNIRRHANEWLTGHKTPARIEVYRTNPRSGTTYAKTEWEARLVPTKTKETQA